MVCPRCNSQNVIIQAVTETSTALLENLHKLANQSCTIEGLCKVSRPDIWGKDKEYPAIRIRIN